ncbi:VOC family protein [Streptomyces pathocidini]|uniref:VOC family protein n=1 Tax=Streptomyces pathocidini TaxID=1650571 RepID=A0ABW7UUG4_9ACTN|nr:VOC family protein [Streptomyces pathocidini]
MNLSLCHFFIAVHDPDDALAFYRDALGLKVRNDREVGGLRWVTLSPPSQPEIEIVLTETHAGRPEEDGDALLVLLTKGSLNGVVFRTDDLDTAFEKIRATGAEVLQEPADQHWGVRECAFRDPSGNMVRLSQPPVDQTSFTGLPGASVTPSGP